MTTCDVIQDLIPLYCDEVASKGSRALVDAHIKDCAVCGDVLKEMKDSYRVTGLRVENADINILKTIKKRIVKKIAIVTLSAVACTVVLLWMVFTWHIPTPFDADNIAVHSLSPENPSKEGQPLNAPPVLDIRNNDYSITFMQIDGEVFLMCKNTVYTRFFRQSGSSRRFNVGDPFIMPRTAIGIFDDTRHLYEIGNNVDRIYYMSADYNKLFRLTADASKLEEARDALEKAKSKAVLVWER